jgi:antitoxin component YwqK of YwqJK toxin-antitoxin module
LEGDQVFYYPDGSVKWRSSYERGVKIGQESYFSPNGNLIWSFQHLRNGKSNWNQWWKNGRVKSESSWLNKKCEGPVKSWDQNGNLLKELKYENGRIVN